jgi:hypothetical protein
MTLGLTQPLTEMSTRNLLQVKGGLPPRKADNLAAICEPIAQKIWKPRCLTTLWAFKACYKDRFTLTHWMGDWVEPRAGLDAEKKRRILPLPGIEPRPSSTWSVAIQTELSQPLHVTNCKPKQQKEVFRLLQWQ